MRLLGFVVSAAMAAVVAVGAMAQEAPYFRFGKFGDPASDPTSSLLVQAPGSSYTLRVNRPASVPAPTVTNNPGPFTWGLESGPLPGGMAIGGDGGIYGTPDTIGYFGGVRLRAYANDGKQGASNAYALSVIGPPAINYVNLTTVRDQNIHLLPNLMNVTGSATYELQGSVPGLRMDGGVLSGVTGSPGTYGDLRVRVVDFDGAEATSPPFSITVLDASAQVAVANGNGRVDMPFSLPFSATGLAAPVEWTLVSGTQPAGIEIDQSLPGFRGVSRVGAAASGLMVKGVDANGVTAWSNAFSISIAPVQVAYPAANASVGVRYDLAPQTQNLLANASWVLSRGVLPPGLGLSDTTGAIGGVPTAEGTYGDIVVSAIDAGGTYASAPFSIKVTADAILVSAASARTRVANTFSAPLTVSNATGPVTFAMKSGSLPTGLSIDSSTARIVGTPTQEADATGLVVEATDANGLRGASAPFSISVVPQPQAIAQPVYTLRRGVASSTKIKALNILGGEQWQPSPGAIVPGVTLDASGNLVGTPQQTALVNNIKATVTDTADGAKGTSSAFTVQVEEPPAATMAVTGVWPVYNVRVGKQVAMSDPSAAPAAGTLTWTLSAGTLPTGLGISSATGHIDGFAGTVGSASGLKVSATDGTSTAESSPFSVVVTGPLQASVSSASVKRGQTLSIAPTLSGLIGQASWTLSGGRLPAGLSFDAGTGRVAGVPTEAGTFAGLVLSVSDEFDGATAQTQPFTIQVAPGLIVRGPSTLSAKAGNAFSSGGSFTVDGATNPVTWELIQGGALPTGLGLASATGVISGVPTTEGLNSNYRMRVTDANGLTGDGGTFSINVSGSLRIVVAPQQNFTLNKASGFTPATQNEVGAVVWAVEEGGLPPGLSFNASNGRVSGVPTSEGEWRIKLRATDSTTATAVSPTFSIFVRRGLTLTLNASHYLYGREGQALTLPAPTIVGNVGAVTFDWAPSVPTPTRGRLNLDPTTGVVTGPLPSDSWYWNIRATDTLGNTAQDWYFVDSTPPVDNMGGGVAYYQNTRYGQVGKSFQFYSGSQNAPSVFNVLGTLSFSVAGGTLPAWATLDPKTGNIYGLPDVAGTTTAVVQACDSYDNNCGSVNQTIIITPAYQTPTNRYLTGRYGKEFRYPNVVTIPSGYTWTDVRVDYPDYDTFIGLDNTHTGFGPSYPNPGFFKNFKVTASKYTSNGPMSESQYFDVDIANALGIDNRYVYACVRTGAPFAFPTPLATGVRGNATFTATQSYGDGSTIAIPGMTFDATTGILSGTPTATYDSNVRFGVTDDWDSAAFSYEQRLRIVPPLTVAPSQPVINGKAGETVYYYFPVNGYSGDTKYRVKSGNLPKGITLDGNYYMGTYLEAGVFSAVVEVSNPGCDGATVETTLTFNIDAKIMPRADDMYARVGVSGRATPTPSLTYAGNPVAWRLWGGSSALPQGMAVDGSTGDLVGAPLASGTYNNIVLEAQDSVATGRTNAFKVIVTPPPTIDYGAARFDYHVDQQVSISPSVANSIGTMNWTVSGTLPQGVTFDARSGTISGTAQAVADANLTVAMADSGGGTAPSVPLRIVVDPVPIGKWVPDRMLSCVNGDGRYACLQHYSCSTALCTTPDPSGHVCTTDGAVNGQGTMPQCYGTFG